MFPTMNKELSLSHVQDFMSGIELLCVCVYVHVCGSFQMTLRMLFLLHSLLLLLLIQDGRLCELVHLCSNF